MKFGNVPGVDKSVSRLVLGTMIVSAKRMEESFALLDAAVAEGFNALDTAHIYSGGDSERAIGQWMQARGNRERIVITTKGAHPNGDRARVTPFDIESDLHDSLARLRTDYIDLYFLHRDDVSVPVGPIVEALNKLLREGKIRAFGGSNWTHARLQEANEYAKARGLTPFAAGSPNYSLAVQVEAPWTGCLGVRSALTPGAEEWYARTKLPLFAWSSLARGLFSGRTTRANVETAMDSGARRAFAHEENFRRLDRADELAKEKGCTTAQIALAWVMNQPVNAFACVGAASREECRANAAALDLKLTASELAWLDLKSETRCAYNKT